METWLYLTMSLSSKANDFHLKDNMRLAINGNLGLISHVIHLLQTDDRHLVAKETLLNSQQTDELDVNNAT